MPNDVLSPYRSVEQLFRRLTAHGIPPSDEESVQVNILLRLDELVQLSKTGGSYIVFDENAANAALALLEAQMTKMIVGDDNPETLLQAAYANIQSILPKP